MTPDDTKKKQMKARAERVLARKYAAVFSTPDGKAVLEDLLNASLINQPAFVISSNGICDPILAATRDGKRGLGIAIQKQIQKGQQLLTTD